MSMREAALADSRQGVAQALSRVLSQVAPEAPMMVIPLMPVSDEPTDELVDVLGEDAVAVEESVIHPMCSADYSHYESE